MKDVLRWFNPRAATAAVMFGLAPLALKGCTIEVVAPDDVRVFFVFCVVDGDTIPVGDLGGTQCADVGSLDSLLNGIP